MQIGQQSNYFTPGILCSALVTGKGTSRDLAHGQNEMAFFISGIYLSRCVRDYRYNPVFLQELEHAVFRQSTDLGYCQSASSERGMRLK